MDGVHIVTSANRHLYARALEQSYRLRHRIYIEELRWRGLTRRDDGREFDQFDTAETVHLLYIEDGTVCGGTRLVPSTGPHLLGDVFAHFAAVRGVPRAPDIAEWTRFHVAPERREEHRASRIGSVILVSMVEYALEEGLTAVSALMNTVWLPRFLGYGWRVRPLGLPDLHDGEWLVAATIEISPQALAGVRLACGVPGSALIRRGPRRPLIRERHDVPAVA